jgi:hypothetical protein
MNIDFVLTACNMTHHYLHLYPLVFKTWRKVCNLDCYLILINNEIPDFLKEYEEYIILFPPLEEVHDIFTAQVIRILYPCIFENRNILITDIDIFPVSRDYFLEPLKKYSPDHFITYRDKYIPQNMYAVCYNVANSNIWREIFGITYLGGVIKVLVKWYKSFPEYNGTKNCQGWFTDQEMLFKYVNHWNKKTNKLVILNDSELNFSRLDKRDKQAIVGNFNKVLEDISSKKYTDFHSIKPFERMHNYIRKIVEQIHELYKGKKIAICFSGAIRAFNTCFPSVYLHFLQNFKADIFVHMWHIKKVDANLDVSFKMRSSGEEENLVEDFLEKLKPKKYVIDEYNSDWEKKIISGIGMENVNFPEGKKNYAYNAMGMYYKIFMANELRKEYEKENNVKYDFVFRARLDYIFEDFLLMQDISPIMDNMVYLVNDRYATNSKKKTNDKFFGGTPLVMDIMCNIYNDIPKYYQAGYDIEGQTLLENQIIRNNFDVKMIGHQFTYYKCQGRHERVIRNKYLVFPNLDSNMDFTIAYNFLSMGYKVFVKNIKKIYKNILGKFENFYEDEKIRVYQEIENYNFIYYKDKNNFRRINPCRIICLKNTNQKLLNKLVVNGKKVDIYLSDKLVEKYTNLSPSQSKLAHFIISILLDESEIRNEFILKNEKEIEPKIGEKLTFRIPDRGDYISKLVEIVDKNNNLIYKMENNEKIKRKNFTFTELNRKYEENYLVL